MIVIEKLSLASLPHLLIIVLKEKIKRLDSQVYFLDSDSPIAIKLFSLFFVEIKKLEFTYDGLFDDKGYNIGFMVIYDDLLQMWLSITERMDFEQRSRFDFRSEYLLGYIKKKIMTENWPSCGSKKSIRNVLLMVRAATIHFKALENTDRSVFIIDKRPWMGILSDYAKDYGIELVPVKYSEGQIISKIVIYLRYNRFIKYAHAIMKKRFEKHRPFR